MDTDVVEQSGPGTATGGDAAAGHAAETPEATIDEVDQLLDGVEAALTRLDEGTYGTCGDCGVAIDDARLSADPTAQTCGTCDGGVTDDRGMDRVDSEVTDAPEDAGTLNTGPAPWAATEPSEG